MSLNDSFEVNLLNDVYEDINNGDIDEALDKLENYLEDKGDKFDDCEYCSLENPMEVELFNHYFRREIKVLPDEMPLKEIYYTLGFLFLEFYRLEEAREALLRALEFNPVSAGTLFELMEVHKRLKDFDSFKTCLDDVFNFAYTPMDLARAYRYLGFYSVEVENYNLAVSAYIYSLKYESNDLAYQELAYIKDLGHKIDIDFDDVIEILRENDVPLTANSFIVSKFRQWGDEYAEKELFEDALNMYGFAYSIDDSIENQMRYRTVESILNGNDDVEIRL